MPKLSDLDTVPDSVVRALMKRVLFSIPEGAGSMLSGWGEGGDGSGLRPIVEAALGAHKEVCEFAKERRRDLFEEEERSKGAARG